MARFGNFDQYLDNAGDPLAEGKLYFYESGTTTPKTTYADVNNSIPNTNPVLLTAAGRQPNIFFDGVAKVILTDNNDVQIAVRDPVGETATDFGDEWVASKIYSANDVVLGSDGVYYRSLSNGNQNNNPVTSTGYWTLLYSVEWNSGITYSVGDVVTYNTQQYQSLQNSNINQNPASATSYWVSLAFAWLSTATYSEDQNVVGTDGILYTSLQNSNTGNDPASSPAYWVGTSAAAAASAVAAAASAAAALVSENAAAADAIATAADVVQTNLDAAATAADAIATAADRVQTGLDAAATAADVILTNADAVATAADRVQTGLDAAATAADAIATAADRVQTGLDVIATNADASATAADAIATAADRVQTGLDATATAADVVQTGLDATAAAGSASAASASAIAAAGSASDAAAKYDEFDDRYLGEKASDPSVDNDGNPLVTGALYFNNVSNVMKVYTGSAWTNVAPTATSVTVSQISDYTGDATTLNYTSGLTSDAQTQIDGKEPADATILKDADIGSTVQAYDSNLTSFVGTFTLPTTDGTTGQVLSTNGTGTLSLTSVSSYTDADVDTHLNTATASSGEMLSWNGSDYDWVAGGGLLGDTDSGSPYLTAVGYNSNTNVTGTHNTVVGYHITAPSITGGYNTTVGFDAGTSLTSGESNVFIGYGAGDSVTTGSKNTAISSALTFLTTASENVAVGWQSLAVQTSGSGNVAVGVRAGDAVTSGSQLTLIGTDAGGSIATASGSTHVGNRAAISQSGSQNTSLGYNALNGSGSGYDNVAIGYSAGNITSGIGNVAVGATAGGFGANISGNYNIYMGPNSGRSATSADRAIGIGYDSLRDGTAHTDCVAVGAYSLQNVTTGTKNVGIGYESGNSVTTGYYNTLFGTQSGYNIGTGYGNTCLGYYTWTNSASAQYQIVIGYNLTGQANNNVTIGSNAGKIYNAYTVNATWTQTSDVSMKTNIKADNLGLSFVNRLNPITFTWKSQSDLPVDHPYYSEENEKDTTTVIHGFIAQEVKAAMDAEGCTTFNGWDKGSDGIEAISREMFISPLVKAVQELSAQVEDLKAEIAALKGA